MKHSIDLAFILILFTTFSLSGIAEVLLGSQTYQKIHETTTTTTHKQIGTAYLSQKVHQAKSYEVIDDTTLCLYYDGYMTYIFYDDACLKEMTTTAPTDMRDGQIIIKNIHNFHIETNNHLIKIQFNDNEIYIKGVESDA